MTPEHTDVLIVGAGISGICAGYYLQTHCPKKSFTILEGRDGIGGTWDLFRYPGIRSDSDMYTLGYSFRPWNDDDAIAHGTKIMDYLKETVDEFGLEKYMRFGMYVKAASWSSEASLWTLDVAQKSTGEIKRFTCNFLYMCSGYYNYEHGYAPTFAGSDDFQGQIVHPQKWSEDIDYEGKKVVVIGSGATAVTLVPSMAEKAAHVTMLQRSPTYIVSRPAQDPLAKWLRKRLPHKLAFHLTRWRNILYSMWIYRISKRRPQKVKEFILAQAKEALSDDFDVETHLNPRYNPWDQRMCLIPDGDLFNAINEGRASIVTDQIERFTEKGVKLQSGEELEADLIVTATGLELKFLGGVQFEVDGQEVVSSEIFNYKGVMFSDVPNLALAFGYTNASWTLKCELSCMFVCRLLNTMDKKGYKKCMPVADGEVSPAPFLNLTANYIKRARDKLPQQGAHAPWKLRENYVYDMMNLRYSKLEDDALRFS